LFFGSEQFNWTKLKHFIGQRWIFFGVYFRKVFRGLNFQFPNVFLKKFRFNGFFLKFCGRKYLNYQRENEMKKNKKLILKYTDFNLCFSTNWKENKILEENCIELNEF
jgi:hypothetical protein